MYLIVFKQDTQTFKGNDEKNHRLRCIRTTALKETTTQKQDVYKQSNPS